MASAEFLRPADVQEICALLAQCGERAKILAGGTDLMVAVNQDEQPLDIVIYIGCAGLDHISEIEGDLVIGAAATHTSIVRSAMVREKAPLLVEGVRSIGSPAIRNMGTIGGNIANASPGADGSVALLALGASVKLISTRGERIVDLEDFFTGYGETVMQADELLHEVIIPSRNAANKWRWYKLGQRKASVCATISVAMALRLDAGVCSGARIAMGTVAPMPVLAKRAGEMLEGQRVGMPLIESAAEAATEAVSDREGVRATAWYRRTVCKALVTRFLGEFAQEAQEMV
ncbi:MAG: FAD binding domain-containing protein [Planctomycetota bacterium]|jgi:carbon-monoxide dehydrogenase medium subunit